MIGYSQHSGGEGTTWGSDVHDVLDGTHPVVYPAEGSHANFFGAALYLGRSADTGVGCDDTREPHTDLRPEIALMPTDRAAYLETFPWLAARHRPQPRPGTGSAGRTGRPRGDHNALTVLVVVLRGDGVRLLAYLCVLAAVGHSVDVLGRGQTPSPLDAYRAVLHRLRPLTGVSVRIVAVVALLLVLVVGLGAVTGPLAGIAILLISGGTTFWLINLIAGVVYAVTIPYVALVMSYQYADLAARTSSDEYREPELVS